MARDRFTPKQERWFNLYLEIGNGSEAYRRVYDCPLMSDPQPIPGRSITAYQSPGSLARRAAQQAAWEAAHLAKYFAR